VETQFPGSGGVDVPGGHPGSSRASTELSEADAHLDGSPSDQIGRFGGFALGHRAALIQVLLTGAVFFVGFAVPVLAGLHVGGVVSIWNGSLSLSSFFGTSNSQAPERLFPEAFQINAQGSHLRLQHQEDLNPKSGQDFLFTAWFNLRRLPLPGEKLILLSKYDGSGKTANGYAIGLSRDEKSLRPVVYWGNSESGGRWYDFPEISLSQRSWFMLALSFSGERYLGLYQSIKSQSEGQEVDELQLLGGYELADAALPSSEVPLLIGAVNERPFRGLIGPLAMYSGKKISQDLKKTLRGIVKVPTAPAEDRPGDSLVMWVPKSSALGTAEARTPEGSQFIQAPAGKQGADREAGPPKESSSPRARLAR